VTVWSSTNFVGGKAQLRFSEKAIQEALEADALIPNKKATTVKKKRKSYSKSKNLETLLEWESRHPIQARTAREITDSRALHVRKKISKPKVISK